MNANTLLKLLQIAVNTKWADELLDKAMMEIQLYNDDGSPKHGRKILIQDAEIVCRAGEIRPFVVLKCTEVVTDEH